PPAHTGAKARPRAWTSRIGGRTRRGAGSACRELGRSRCRNHENRSGICPHPRCAAIVAFAQTCWNIAAAGRQRKRAMSLLIVYVGLVIMGNLIAYFVGLVIERTVPAASLPVFLAMYFLFLWVSWVIAVRITQPRVRPQ